MRTRDMNKGRKSEMLRSTGKNGEKRNGPDPFGCANQRAANGHSWRIVA